MSAFVVPLRGSLQIVTWPCNNCLRNASLVKDLRVIGPMCRNGNVTRHVATLQRINAYIRYLIALSRLSAQAPGSACTLRQALPACVSETLPFFPFHREGCLDSHEIPGMVTGGLTGVSDSSKILGTSRDMGPMRRIASARRSR